jgi:death-on-curing protein
LQNEPAWLPIEEVIDINEFVVEQTGEGYALLRRDLLESALARPRNAFYHGETNVLRLATTLLFAIANNHPFEQGNKRTGFYAFGEFLALNGYTLMAGDDQFGPMVIDVITGVMSEEEFIIAAQDNIE